MTYDLVGLDFETYSAANLPEVGLHNYITDKTFAPLLAAAVVDGGIKTVFDFTLDIEDGIKDLQELLEGRTIVAHNAGFEQLVLQRIEIDLPSSRFIDSAVLARACGYGSSLEAAAPQILGIDKVAAGKELIQLFSIPHDELGPEFDLTIVDDFPLQWDQFKYYCQMDAELSLAIAKALLPQIPEKELRYAAITMDMNSTGWPVDMGLVFEMDKAYHDNIQNIEDNFRILMKEPDLNLNSHKQLVEWCTERGVRARSFDEKHVRRLIARLEKRVTALPDSPKTPGYEQVLELLYTKQALGGSSLKKLGVIQDQVGLDNKLYDQYLHAGAGATLRTTGRGVQMQNLKRLNGQGDDVSDIDGWTNEQMASNLRQVFKASHPDGRLIVGDFASVESRGLAWQAGEEWKLEAYRNGDDLYKVLAGKIFGKYPNDVTKDERQVGKTGELSCGYGAGAEAVKAFAENMGVELTEPEAAKLVRDWRDADPATVQYWKDLETGLRQALTTNKPSLVLTKNVTVLMRPVGAPESLCKQTDDAMLRSLRLEMWTDELLLTRTIHGVHEAGRNIRYWKPSARKTGDLWTNTFTDPKTGLLRNYTLYGGKLAGLLTQSLCREIFFERLEVVQDMVLAEPNLRLIGQFHDEIVLEWNPDPYGIGLDTAISKFEVLMSSTQLAGFPLAATVKADHRYTK